MIKQYLESKDWQTFLNKRLVNTRYAVIDKNEFPIVESRTGELFYHHPDLCTYTESLNQYNLDGVRRDDTVVDIGANIGAFSLIMAKRCLVVHAWEPVEYDALVKNIELNKEINRARNLGCWVIPHKIALGYQPGKVTTIGWQGKEETVQTCTLSEIIKSSVGCNFLKCDAEGAEWGIQPEELKGVRRIEMEFHHVDQHLNEWPPLAKKLVRMFDFTAKVDAKTKTMWISGVNKNEGL